MKRFYPFFILLLFLSIDISAQDVNFEWVGQVPRCPAGSSENYSLGVDARKNVYTAGNYEYTNDFDPGPGIYNLTSVTPAMDIYISKLDSYGKLIWAKSLGGKGDDFLGDLAVDAVGNLYCSGTFFDTADFDPGAGIVHLGGSGGFLSKFDTDGNLVWASKVRLASNHSMAMDESGNIYLTGIFHQGEDIDPGPGVVSTSIPGTHTSVAKFDNNGNFLWVKMLLGSRYAYSQSIQLDKKKNIYITGMQMGTMDADPGVNIFNVSSVDIFTFTSYICKLDSSGNLKWAMPGIGDAIAVDAQENVISYNGDITKYDVNGNLLWTKASGGFPLTENNVKSRMLCVDSLGSIYISGSFQNTRDFDPGPNVFNMTSVVGIDLNDMFLSKLDADGKFLWAKQFGSFHRDMFYAMILDNSGNIYTTGIFMGTVDFDPGTGDYNLTYYPWSNFILKLSPCPNHTDSILLVNSCSSYKLNNILYDSSGTYTQIIANAVGCDSLITLKLNINNKVSDTTVVSCKEFTWRNFTYTNSGVYNDTLVSSNGCDSILRLSLVITPVRYSSVQNSICAGGSFDGYFATGVYIDTLVAANGCDSIRTLTLFVNPRVYTTLTATICEGGNYNGHTLAGNYNDTLIAVNGCDSIVTLNLKVNSKKITNIYAAICKGNSYGGHTSSGIYYDSLFTQNGCDSIVVTHLTVNQLPKPNLGSDRNICLGQQVILNPGIFESYHWQDNSIGNSFTAKSIGIFFVQVKDTNNCLASDTIRIIKTDTIPFNFLPPDNKICIGAVINIALKNYKSYEWNTGESTSYISIKFPGRYVLKVKDFNDCVSIDTIDILLKGDCIPISIPTAFSPNDDNLNDSFRPVITQQIQTYKMEIYNRYGQKIFETTDPHAGWDGKFKGREQNSGSYIYRIYFKNNNGVLNDKKGSFILIR